MIINCEEGRGVFVAVVVKLEAGDHEDMVAIVSKALLALCDGSADITRRRHKWSRRYIITVRTNIRFYHGDCYSKVTKQAVAAIQDLSNQRNVPLQVRGR